MRDAKGRFKTKELLLPLSSATIVLNILFSDIYSTSLALCGP